MQQTPPTTQTTLRNLRILHGSMMISILLYLYAMRVVPAANTAPLNPAFPWELGVVAAYSLVTGLRIRAKKLRYAFETLRTIPDDPTALASWQQGVVIGDCMALAVVLFGFVIHVLGGKTEQVAPFFVAGAAAMLFWWPKEP